MKSGLLCLLCLFGAFSTAPALERTIILPDSFGGLIYPYDIAVDPLTNRLYVVGDYGDRVVVLDGATTERRGVLDLPTPFPAWRVACDARAGRVYVLNADWCQLAILDCAAETLVSTVERSGGFIDLCVDEIGTKLYCHGYTDTVGVGSLLVIDGARGDILSQVLVGEPVHEVEQHQWLTYDPESRKLYCPGATPDGSGARIDIIDGVGDTLTRTITFDDWEYNSIALDTAHDRVFCMLESTTGFVIAVIDTRSDTMVDLIDLGDNLPWDIIIDMRYSQATDRLICLETGGQILSIDVAGRRIEDGAYLPQGSGWQLLLNPGGQYAFCMDDFFVTVIDCRSFAAVGAEVDMWFPAALEVNPITGLAYCVADEGSKVVAIDTTSAVLGTTLTGWELGCDAVDDAAGRYFLANLSEPGVLAFDIRSGELLGTVPTDGIPTGLLSRQGKLYCTDSEDNLYIIDVDELAAETTLTLAREPRQLCYIRQDDRLFVACYRGCCVCVVDAAGGRLVSTLPTGGKPSALYPDPATGRVFCLVADSVVVLTADRVVGRFAPGGTVQSLHLDAASRVLYCSNTAGEVALFDADRLELLHRVATNSRLLEIIGLDNNRGYLYCHSKAVGAILVLDCAGDSVIRRYATTYFEGASLDPAADALYIVDGRPLRVTGWEASSGRLLFAREGLCCPDDVSCSATTGDVYVRSLASRVYILETPTTVRVLTSPTGPTHLKSELTLLGTRRATVHDITGRKVADFAPGRNALTGLSAGIYFVRREGEQKTSKVVVTR